MKQFSFTNGIYSYIINVNQSRRTFTMVENVYEKGCKPYRRYKGKSIIISKSMFESYLDIFNRLETHKANFKSVYFFKTMSYIFPDYD